MITDKDVRLECLRLAYDAFRTDEPANAADIANILIVAEQFANLVIARPKPRPSIIDAILGKATETKAQIIST